jgi:hypothetical protein
VALINKIESGDFKVNKNELVISQREKGI